MVVQVSGLLVLNGGRSIFTASVLPLGVYMVTGAQMGMSRRFSRIENPDPKYCPVPGVLSLLICGLRARQIVICEQLFVFRRHMLA